MKISTKGRYALRLLIDLAQHNDSGFITLKDIAARQNISKKYLEQIVPILTKSQMVQSNRGFKVDTNFLKVQIKSVYMMYWSQPKEICLALPA